MSVVHTAVITRKLKPGRERDYDAWLAHVAATLREVEGYDGMTALSSPASQDSVRTLLVRFQSSETLSHWEQSPVRQSLADEGNRFSTYYYQTAPGVETFFALPGSASVPPRWKMCLLTIPTVYLLLNVLLFVLLHLIPGMKNWPNAVRMVPVICVMTLLLTYVCLPALSKVFAPWLFSRSTTTRTKSFEAVNT
jgi:antibiotic biosynthesis monooxygenase (ABM) superfamily enzyme